MNTYTNTSKVSAVAGLIVTTVALAYAQNHADDIVNGTVAVAKNLLRKANEIAHGGKREHAILERVYVPGKGIVMVDTGKRIWQ